MGSGKGGGTKDDDAKYMFDRIGKDVYDQVKKDGAETYKDYLKGNLTDSSIWGETVTFSDTCNLVQKYYTKRLGGNGDPCTNLSGKVEVKRFSDTLGGQCTNSKMRSGGEGACAPYRRLHLCHHNLETINNTTSTTSDTLLAEVCMAAKYEGNSINTPYPQHQQTNNDSASQLCTVLARSFADIGDIIRGRDLFHGNPQEKEKRDELEKNLKTIFEKIHSGLTKNGAKDYYKDDAKKNFYRLREDWWTANRATVWKALTCDVKSGNNYFRRTCGDEKTGTLTPSQCRCNGDKPDDDKANTDPPTYFDYVPQYLRWFEEWAEDFCRLRKRKLEDAKNKCRKTESGQPKYCDLNRHDCVKTIRGDHDFVEDEDCKYCHFSCSHFVNWIDNQKLEFLKQKNKYGKEISGGGGGSRRQKRGTTTKYEGYEKKFYGELKKNKYVKVGEFLDLLSKEKTCTKNNDIEDRGNIDFKTVKSSSAKNSGGDGNKTFYRTTYCEACPWCGAQKKSNGGGWEAKTEPCGSANTKVYDPNKTTNIPILTGDKTKSEIVERYTKFCKNNGKNGVTSGGNGATGTVNGAASNSDNATTGYCGGNSDSSLCEKWTCYYKKNNKDGKKDINFCVLQDGNENTKDQKDKSYNAFFWDWVYHMLHDSLDWRKQLGNCINNNTNDNRCKKKNKCKDNCECFAKWVEHKQQEWDAIKKHFLKQDDIKNQTDCDPIVTLEFLLEEDELLKNIKDTHANADDIDRIEKMLQQAGVVGGGTRAMCGTGGANGQNSIIDKLLKHEKKDATKCKDCQEPQQSLGRSLNPHVVDDDGSPKKRDKRTNPCYSDTTTEYAVLAEKVAQILQGEAQTQLGQNKSSLLGDIKKAEFKNKAVKVGALKKVCELTKDHTNDSRHGIDEYKGPCTGKDGGNERFNAGTKWEGDNFVSATHKNLYIPPRRQHMCTSNLEKLNYASVIGSNNVNDTFLVDVLLAAKEEAEDIKNNYNEGNNGQNKGKTGLNNEKTVCRAMKNSFADIGDIIRGRDLWDEDSGAQDMERNLKKIFENIKNNHPGIKVNDKYTQDENKTPPYKQMREDWWEANRDQVWKAMKCKTPHGNFPCSGTDVPLEDYVPQRLRWMTEWAEWFCKMQSQEYENLFTQCMTCKNNRTKCTSGESEVCKQCKAACDNYTKVVREWEEQWNNMLLQYTLLYWQAKTTAAYGTVAYSGDVEPKDKPVVAFLQKLQKQNSGKTTYDTAAGYIHQELPHTQCQIQKHFCTSDKEDKDYVFRDKPNDHDDECNCDKKTASSPEELGRRERNEDEQSPQTPDHSESASDSEEDEEEEEEEDVDEPQAEEEEEKGPTVVDVCATVAKALTGDNLTQACQQKYEYGREKFPNWKCVTPSGSDTTGSGKDGAICIPPRRRKLYLHKIEGVDTTTESLRDWFVKSAAVETFFLWHKYKVENTKSKGETQSVGNGDDEDDPDTDPETSLKKGKIPDGFLHQMFYTLGDYRDILYSGSNDNTKSSTYNDILKGDKEIKGRESKIQEQLKKFFQNNGNQPSTSVTTPQQTWWKENAQHIWHGMICALTYKENGAKGTTTPLEQIEGAQNLLNKIKEETGKEKGEYHYEKVTLENSGTQPKTNDPLNNPKLENFVKIPTYFRWLHEWGSDFCGTRKRMLEKIKEECMDGDGKQKKCSGDGEDCKTILSQKYNIFPDFNCPSCSKPCGLYKRWIKIKKDEFNKQKEAYTEQKTKCQKENEDAASFLEKLKNGPCKTDNENAEDKLDFSQPDVTFRPATNCGTCSQFKIKCENGKCKNGGETNVGCTGNNGGTTTITANHIGNGGRSTQKLDMLVSDDSKSGSGFDGLGECKEAHIFKGIRKDEWECGNVCGYNVCKPKSDNGENVNGNQIIIIRALFKRWLEYFLKDYNKIRTKLKPCMNKGEESPCINDYDKKHKCVEQWIKLKKDEWQQIKKHYLKQNEDGDKNLTSLVKNFLEELQHLTEFKEAIKPCGGLKAFESFCGLNGAEKSKTKGDDERDLVVCFLEKLEKKIEQCKKKHDETSVENGGKSCTPLDNTTLEEPLEEEDQNPEDAQKMIPKICGEMKEETKQEEGEDECKAAETPIVPENGEPKENEQEKEDKDGGPTGPQEPSPKADSDGEANPNEPTEPAKEKETKDTKPDKDKDKVEKAPVKPPSQPTNPPQVEENPFDNPAVIPPLVTSTLAWSVGIGFAAFTYFFLKKKTHTPVDLLRVINIPKSDYDIPTKLSPNRYIPYTSGKYRGKRYIYLEGDSGTDSGYTDHYSDITSSSESEYEELDINDIYVPGSPKYKTLIEVVLEPSGKLSGNTIPTSGNNTTASDTQNDIQNDGIPSNKFTDNEWNTLKDEFISQYLQSEQPKDVPNDYRSGNSSTNTNITTTSRDNMEEKPFITSIHDRNLYSGEEYSYNVNMVNSMDDIPINSHNNVYSGIDLINDTLGGNKHIDIYDELLKRKENELFGTNHTKKNTSTNSVAKLTNSDPIHNQLELFHKWLDRHRDMCEKWENHHERLAKLKELWENETHSGNINPSGNTTPTSDIPSGKQSDIPSDNNIHSDIPYVLNTDVSIQIHMDNPKTTNEFTYVDSNPNQVDDTYVDSNPDNSSMDTILEDLDKPFNEPYYYDMYDDDIYYDVHDHDTSTVDSNAMDIPSKVQIEMDVNTKLVKEKYPIADVWDI
ncbi:variant-specific surface protein 2 [Plasmodium falciparum RAJ116]|uniref:Variant-specific surface protein 2 n=1 Tax=Plasmodium falciparum RAJ116 TaxID=580058 RepID=A0A0L0CS46_PLAFA|nr:variant-specific surface protein 2 [Plasmodium falciparum RAJ116]